MKIRSLIPGIGLLLGAALMLATSCVRTSAQSPSPAAGASSSPSGGSPAPAGSTSERSATVSNLDEFRAEVRKLLAGPDGKVVLSSPGGQITLEKKGADFILVPPKGKGEPQKHTVEDTWALVAKDDLDACKGNLKDLGTALGDYAKDNGGKYPASLSAVTPKYLKALPTCPSAGKDSYAPGYATTGNAYTVACSGDNHSHADLTKDFPRYTSAEGLLTK